MINRVLDDRLRVLEQAPAKIATVDGQRSSPHQAHGCRGVNARAPPPLINRCLLVRLGCEA
jgi:hypothetical protein